MEPSIFARRVYFTKLIHDSGIRPAITLQEQRDFATILDKVYLITPEQANSCSSPEMAKLLYYRAKSLIGASTKEFYSREGIDFFDQLLTSYSDKAILENIIVKGLPKVFKYPMVSHSATSITRDYEFCNEIAELNGGELPEGLVKYEPFSINSGRRVIRGSISRLYPLILNKLGYPLSDTLLIGVLNRLVQIISSVHALNFAINDIKPSNLFMKENGEVDIGDFGATTLMGGRLVEISFDYAPNDLIECRIATPAIDWMCLTNSIFEMKNLDRWYMSRNITLSKCFGAI